MSTNHPNRFNRFGNRPDALRLAAIHPDTARCHGCDLIETDRLADHPLRLEGRTVTRCCEALYAGQNPIPAQAFFLDQAAARQGVELLLQARSLDVWWRLAHETGLEAFAGGSLLHRGYRISQRIVGSPDDPAAWSFAHGFEAFLPAPYDFRSLLPPGQFFESLAEAVDAADLHLDGPGLNPAFWILTRLATPEGMVPHGSCIRALETYRAGAAPAPQPSEELVLDGPPEEVAQPAEPALGEDGDYRGFIYTVYVEDSPGGETRTRIWSSEQEMTLNELPGAASFATVQAVVDAYYAGLSRKRPAPRLAGSSPGL